MIPSRIVLKEKIDERFKILQLNGIKNLKDLIDVLKTKQKIELFSNKTALSIDYLSILKREASSYLPNPIRLKDFTRLNSKDIKALEDIGIKNSRQLFKRVTTEEQIDQLSQSTGISIDRLNEMASLTDLARLYGVGPVFAGIIFDIGIKSVKTFVKYGADEIINIYEKKTQKKADFSVSDISFSIELAKELETD